MDFWYIVKIIILGIIEGVTEWLPISSTGHMLLVDEFINLNVSPEFKEMFFVVIQLGAILSVVLLFWNKMFPFQFKDKSLPIVKKETFQIWFKVCIACIPGLIATILFDDLVDTYLYSPWCIAIALIVYGIAFILIENKGGSTVKTATLSQLSYKTALYIGFFQVLSIIPGTSRSGATIVGALLLGVSRITAAEFTFFMAVPVILGLSIIKIIKFGFNFTSIEIATLIIGMVVAFLVSVLVIKFLMDYIKKHDFKVFGWYRIILGIAVLLYFIVT